MGIHLGTILDFLFPPSPEELLVRGMTEQEVLRMHDRIAFHNCIALSDYHDTRMRALIHRVKYHHDQRAVELLAGLLHTHLITYTEPQLIIPIPLSKARQQSRGYNQSEIIARRAVEDTIHTLRTDILVRARDTVPQTHLSREARLTNLSGAFSVIEVPPKASSILLIDDVTTTGATFTEATRTLQRSGARHIRAVSLAH